jgi:hypothetical protein
MRYAQFLACVMASAVCASCAVMDPYIKQPGAHDTDSAGHGNSTGNSGDKDCVGPDDRHDRHDQNDHDDPAFMFACDAVRKLEDARSAIVRTQAATIATLLPLAGAIGYNSARGLNAPSSLAMATGGMAAYSVVGTLAQPDRIRAYDAGLNSLSCAMDIYLQAAAAAPVDPGLHYEIRNAIEAARTTEEAIENNVAHTTKHRTRQQLTDIRVFLESARNAVRAAEGQTLLGAQLTAMVRKTLVLVNAQLAKTVPRPIDVLNGAYGTFGSTLAKASKPPAGFRPLEGRGAEVPDELDRKIEAVIAGLERLQAHPQVQANFSQCDFAFGPDATFQSPLTPFMVGANDSMANRLIPGKPGEALQIPLFGGKAPYSAAVSRGTPPAPTVTVEADAGIAILKINLKDVTALPGKSNVFDIVVSDATGQQTRQLSVEIAPAPIVHATRRRR